MKLIITILALLVICNCQANNQSSGNRGGHNTNQLPGRDSPQLQLQYCLIQNCRAHIETCRKDENCFKLLQQCPPKSYSSITECFQVSINENKNLSGLVPFYNCITDKCKDIKQGGGHEGHDMGGKN